MTLATYRNFLVLVFGATVAGVWILALVLHPADGDLARVGGYPENDFHWKTPQAVFPKNLFTVSRDLAEYDRHYDVVVLGDSFSCDQEGRLFGWQNYFLAETGLSMIVFDTRRFWPQEILDLPIFKTSPPKLFIFESVERYLHMRTAYFAKHARVSSAPLEKAEPFPRRSLPVLQEDIPFARPSLDPEHVLTHLNSLTLRLLGLNTQVIKTSLTTDKHFSSPNNRELLVFFDEYTKKDLTGTDFENMRTGLKIFQSLVESNGVTKFVVVIAPDKSSLYAPWLVEADMATVNLIAEAAKDPHLPVLRTDLIFADAMESPDVYLPSDSHWSSRGHRLVAEGLLDMLQTPR
jgi:hypothetical protein